VLTANSSELCYEVIKGMKLYHVLFAENSENCTDCSFIYDCKGCQHCFGCTNLRNKSYYFFNVPCTKEEYQERIKEFNLGKRGDVERARVLFNDEKLKAIRRPAFFVNTNNSTGDYLDQCESCKHCFNSYRVHYSFNVHDSMDSLFLYDCRNMKDCFMCWNLRNKQYCILNEQYTKEDYFRKVKSFNTRSFSGIQDLKKEFWKIVAKNAVHRENYNTKTVDSVGNFLSECKNCQNCFFLDRSENCRHVFRGFETKDGIYTIATIGEKCAFSAIDAYIYETAFTSHCSSCRYSMFLDYCEECEYCFGCVGLKKKKYCILNKQYTKEEYKELKEKIVKNMKEGGELGRFFPYSMGYC
jgi:hypothetical protein